MANNDQGAMFVFYLLPQKLQKLVIERMEPINTIAFSLCSERTKLSVISSKSLRPTVFRLLFAEKNIIRINICEYEICITHRFGDTVEVFYKDNVNNGAYIWLKTGFNGNKWLKHFKSICSITKINPITIDGEPDINAIGDMLSGTQLGEMCILENTTMDQIEPLLRRLPILDGFEFYGAGQFNEVLYRIMRQNMSMFDIDSERVIINVDQILMCNSSHIAIFNKAWFTKNVNRFIKLWRRGSNERLRSLEMNVLFDGKTYENCLREIFNGIDTREDQQVRVFKYDEVYTLQNDVSVENGKVFDRFDGVQAVCTQELYDAGFIFQMFVFSSE